MEITKTRDELIQEAADKLSIVGTGMTLEAEQSDYLDRNVDTLLLRLMREGICNVANDEEIPSEWFDALAHLLANQCAPLGGKNYDPNVKAICEAELRRLTSAGPTYRTLPLEFI